MNTNKDNLTPTTPDQLTEDPNKPPSIYGRRRKSNPLIHAHFDPDIVNLTPKIITRLQKDLDMMIEGFEKITKEKIILREELTKLNQARTELSKELTEARATLSQLKQAKGGAHPKGVTRNDEDLSLMDIVQDFANDKSPLNIKEMISANEALKSKAGPCLLTLINQVVSGEGHPNADVGALNKELAALIVTNNGLYKNIMKNRDVELKIRNEANRIKEENRKLYRENIKIQSKMRRASLDKK